MGCTGAGAGGTGRGDAAAIEARGLPWCMSCMPAHIRAAEMTHAAAGGGEERMTRNCTMNVLACMLSRPYQQVVKLKAYGRILSFQQLT